MLLLRYLYNSVQEEKNYPYSVKRHYNPHRAVSLGSRHYVTGAAKGRPHLRYDVIRPVHHLRHYMRSWYGSSPFSHRRMHSARVRRSTTLLSYSACAYTTNVQKLPMRHVFHFIDSSSLICSMSIEWRGDMLVLVATT